MNSNHKWKKPTELIINKEIWLQVKDFNNSKPFDRHFVVKQLKSGNDVLIFGNGINGARPSDRYPTFASAYQTNYQTDNNKNNNISPPDISQKMDFNGIYRAVIINNRDPNDHLKVLVEIDSFPHLGRVWASPVIPLVENEKNLPDIGQAVWVSFRDQDPSQPLWLGRINEENHSSSRI